ncbi:50S ribosomal protein L17 [Candidatus Kaiserbacteria bacterium RIFCSPHIGHO2_12_FULL_53_13]|uniref:50S ribosomal protein L17 n=1 Tax=Candidatus Kaiserbacteria bacterium RIFCSPHIGHO2_12_FULL_53_13 TaxID=1798502 RepID=A0A1F6E7A0_9BACT|nr:MAG: 50S ribosomal protein L17 [Candidatus Kaiserbacteria bacterium RIFCSPHIGHO2_12_FULL_53_13]OGG74438.1 MAG: 50S ribosomal protein L17 [Candidatus Kaiserbacteria bacterium RIFCSPLOWO2_01_FULL_52_36]
MKHHKKGRTLGRKHGGRVALMRSLARSLVLREGIVTTISKAKELRPFVEQLVSASKKNTASSRRSVSSQLGGAPDAVKKLHDTIAPRFAKRAGGYTRVIRLGRVGKRVLEAARIEFV